MSLKETFNSGEKRYEEGISKFTPLTSKEVKDQLTADDNKIVFVGRSNCPYCRKFLPKLLKVMENEGLNIYYLDSSNHSDAILTEFRELADIKTVPSLIRVGGEGHVKNLGLDSSAKKEEISEAIANA